MRAPTGGLLPLRVESSYNRNVHGESGDLSDPQQCTSSGGASKWRVHDRASLMGQVVLLVVAAAWAAVLLPPLLRSRLENRPNSSVLDFRNQLSSLQRAVPTRGVSRPLDGPFAGAVDAQPSGRRAAGRTHATAHASTGWSARGSRRRRPRPARRAAMPGCRRPPCGLASTAPPPIRGWPPALASSRAAEAKRRRANILFLLVLTTVCAGFLAATTDSKAMVYLFAVSMVALGGYVYLLVTINQQNRSRRTRRLRRPPRRANARERRSPAAVGRLRRRLLGTRAGPSAAPDSAGRRRTRRRRRSDPPRGADSRD